MSCSGKQENQDSSLLAVDFYSAEGKASLPITKPAQSLMVIGRVVTDASAGGGLAIQRAAQRFIFNDSESKTMFVGIHNNLPGIINEVELSAAPGDECHLNKCGGLWFCPERSSSSCKHHGSRMPS